MHHIGRSVGLDCDCSDIHICETLVFGAGNKQLTFAESHKPLTGYMTNRANFIKVENFGMLLFGITPASKWTILLTAIYCTEALLCLWYSQENPKKKPWLCLFPFFLPGHCHRFESPVLLFPAHL